MKAMNWNLNQIKIHGRKSSRLFFLVLIYVTSDYSCLAQAKSLVTGGISISPTFGSSFNRGDSYTDYSDSVKSTQGTRLMWGVHGWINYSLKKKLDIQVGIGYQDIGFSRIQKGLDLNEPTYPGIGVGFIEDKSNTQKDITYNYRFQYLQVPVIFNSYMGRSANYKWVFNFSAGIVSNLLLKHQIVANLNPGFTVDGKKSFNIDSTGFDARRFAFNVLIGAKIEYKEKADTKKTYFFQPAIGFYPLSVAGGAIKSNPWFITINVGMLFVMPKLHGSK